MKIVSKSRLTEKFPSSADQLFPLSLPPRSRPGGLRHRNERAHHRGARKAPEVARRLRRQRDQRRRRRRRRRQQDVGVDGRLRVRRHVLVVDKERDAV